MLLPQFLQLHKLPPQTLQAIMHLLPLMAGFSIGWFLGWFLSKFFREEKKTPQKKDQEPGQPAETDTTPASETVTPHEPVSAETAMTDLFGTALYDMWNIKAWSWIDNRLVIRFFCKKGTLEIAPWENGDHSLIGFTISTPSLSLDERHVLKDAFGGSADAPHHLERTCASAYVPSRNAKFVWNRKPTNEQMRVFTDYATKQIRKFIDIL